MKNKRCAASQIARIVKAPWECCRYLPCFDERETRHMVGHFGRIWSRTRRRNLPEKARIDFTARLANRLIVQGWSEARGEPAFVSINDELMPFSCIRVRRDDVLSAEGVGLEFPGFLIAIDHHSSSTQPGDQVIEISFDSLLLKSKFDSLDPPDTRMLTDAVERIGLIVDSDFGTDHICKLLSEASHASPRPFVDRAVRFDDGSTLVCGWAADSCFSKLYLTTENFEQIVQIEPCCRESRPDVSNFLLEAGTVTKSDIHGFADFVPTNFIGDSVRIVAIDGDSVSVSGARDVGIGRSLGSSLTDTLSALSREGLPSERALNSVYDCMKSNSKSPDARSFEEKAFVAGPEETRVSVVVPFHGDDFFLIDHILAQANAPSDFEWIFVCDDPKLRRSMEATLTNRRSQLRRKTRLIVNAGNYGFAGASNIGASVAEGTYLLFCNSDVYFQSFQPVERGVSQFEQVNDCGVVGFTLLFEDGSVQHDGMTFERHPSFRDKWVCTHKGKGLPLPAMNERCLPVQAVTGALMLIPKKSKVGAEYFSSDFVIGDYEDADLCLTLYQAGLKAYLVRCNEIYHFERQSFSKLGAPDGRLALSYLNCSILNERWSDTIQRLVGEHSS